MLKKIRDLVCGAQETRTGTVVSTLVGALSKPVGYMRTLLLAWLFGASAEMDAFYLSLGILSLICQVVQNVAESALLPRLVRHRDDGAARTLMVRTCAFSLGMALVAGGAAFAFPEATVRFFARQFDASRLRTSAQMLRILMPWAIASIVLSLLGVWNVFRRRYSLNITLSVLGYAMMIPLILAGARVVGVFSVPVVYSTVLVLLAFFVWCAAGDIPVRGGAKLSPGEFRRMGLDALLCLGIVGASSLYQLVDRYFASGLPAGNISAINYASLITIMPLSLLAPALMIYLNRAALLAEDARKAQQHLLTVMSMSWLYLFPPALALALVARPAVSLFLGYGAFGADAVALTAPCITASAWALPLLFWGQLLSRYAQACGKLKTILLVSWGALLLNAFLDWLFVPSLGAPGLCFATGITWGGSALVYTAGLAGAAVFGVFRETFIPSVVFAAASLCAYLLFDGFALILGAALLLCAYYLGGEKCGFFAPIPQNWRPLSLIRMLYDSLKKRML